MLSNKTDSLAKNHKKEKIDSNISKAIIEDEVEIDSTKNIKINLDKAKHFLPTINVKSSLNKIFYNKNSTFTDLNTSKRKERENKLYSKNNNKSNIAMPKSYKENILVPNLALNIPDSRFEKFQSIKLIQRDDILQNAEEYFFENFHFFYNF